MGRRLIEVMQVLVDHVHKGGYQHRVLEDSIHAETQKRIAAEKERDHWRAARQDAIQAGELMQAEIERLRTQLSADAVRQELEELKAKNAELLEKLATVENAAANENERLRTQLDDARVATINAQALLDAARADNVEIRKRLAEETDRHRATNAEKIIMFEHKESANQHAAELVKERDAALAAVSLQRAGIERLRAFVEKVRAVMDREYGGVEFDDLSRALDELDAGNSEAESQQ